MIHTQATITSESQISYHANMLALIFSNVSHVETKGMDSSLSYRAGCEERSPCGFISHLDSLMVTIHL